MARNNDDFTLIDSIIPYRWVTSSTCNPNIITEVSPPYARYRMPLHCYYMMIDDSIELSLRQVEWNGTERNGMVTIYLVSKSLSIAVTSTPIA
jgi:hypothetical protein